MGQKKTASALAEDEISNVLQKLLKMSIRIWKNAIILKFNSLIMAKSLIKK